MARKTKQSETSLVLRVCRADLTSTNGFQWPSKVGEVATAPDWIKNEECGNGLHGWLFGAGGHGSTNYWEAADAKWLVLEVANEDLVMLGGKVKFPSALVRHIGDKRTATDFLLANSDRAKAENCIGATVTAGDGQVAAVGALGTATAGDRGTATAGDSGTATAGYRGTATAGDRGTATAGDRGTATAGDRGTATAGDSGTATAGYRGELRIRWYDYQNDRYRTEIAYVGESGIKPNVAYRLDANHKFVEA
jgi:hypothetical protein